MGTAMTDRADELARRVFENCTHGVSDYDAYGPCLRCTADALRAYAEEARREEREACAAFVERMGALALTIPGAPSPEAAAHVAETCAQIAISIQARGEKG